MSILAGLDAPLDAPLGTGSASSQNVPSQFHVAVAGRSYMLDLAADLNGFRGEHFNRKSQPVQRAQADVGSTPGENSINREDLWRRAQETWHHGAGQSYLDRSDSDSARFLSSKGVDVWSKWALSLLHDTSQVRSSSNTNLRLTAAGSFMYLSDGNDLAYTPDINAGTPTFTTVTGTPVASCQWVTSDGYNVYAAYGASGVYSTTRGAAAAASFNTLPCTLLGYVKGRLMAANANSIYNITNSTPPAALLTQANTDFSWVGFAEGPGFIYAAGYSGTRSLIYKIGITTDATALTAPIVAGELPTGETVRSVKGYLGFLLVGTDMGLRVASIGSNGDLTFGSLIATPAPVLNFEPADRFCWFGYSNYDGTSTGLGRVDLSVFTQPLTPAYASDVMTSGQGAVLSISSTAGRRAFTVSGLGVYVESLNLVPFGTLDTGRITYGVSDDKVAMFLDLKHTPLAGSISAALTVNATSAISMGSSSMAGSTTPLYPLNAGQSRGEFFNVTLTLTRDSNPLLGPAVTRLTMRSYPAPPRSFRFTVPILLHTRVKDLAGNDYFYDPLAERQFLEGLLRSQSLFTYQEARSGYTVLLDDVNWVPIKQTGDLNSFDGTLVLSMKEISQ